MICLARHCTARLGGRTHRCQQRRRNSPPPYASRNLARRAPSRADAMTSPWPRYPEHGAAAYAACDELSAISVMPLLVGARMLMRGRIAAT